MRKYILYGHDGSANHGCEALVRSTIELLNKDKNHVILASANPEEDITYHIDDLCTVFGRGIKVESLTRNWDFLRAYYYLKVKRDFHPIDALYETQALGVGRKDIALAVGGDSYCYNDQMRDALFHQHQLFRAAGLKTVLWGYSFEPNLLEDSKIADDIRSFDLITARESISYEAIKQVNPNTILVSDSAFLLKEKRLPLPKGFGSGDLVGINSSPLIERRESTPGIARKNYEKLIKSILKETDYKILLIPHVIWPANDDRTINKKLYDKYRETGRITALDDCNCQELKGFISRCRFFIGARTHATIAAYSTGVPTLAIGYSTKSKGIAKDLFGTFRNYVIDVRNLKKETDLTDSWNWLLKHEVEIRKNLQDIMPRYADRVYKGYSAVKSL